MSNFAIVVHSDPAGGFWGEVPALPGCYSQGERAEELLKEQEPESMPGGRCGESTAATGC